MAGLPLSDEIGMRQQWNLPGSNFVETMMVPSSRAGVCEYYERNPVDSGAIHQTR